MNCIIIDDEPLARSIIAEYLQNYPSARIVAECNDGFEGLKAIQQYHPDLIFLDIQMPKINGFEMLELIEMPLKVIFTTAFEEYALKAFESNAVDYLLKPFSKERFKKAMDKIIEHQIDTQATQTLLQEASLTPSQSERIVVKDGSKIRIIPIGKIRYIEAADDYVKIFTEENHYLKKRTMASLESTLSPTLFTRIHRSYIVNIQLITRIEAHEKESWIAILNKAEQLPVSKTGYLKLKEVLGI